MLKVCQKSSWKRRSWSSFKKRYVCCFRFTNISDTDSLSRKGLPKKDVEGVSLTNSGNETWTASDNMNEVIVCGVEVVAVIVGEVAVAVEGIPTEVVEEDSIVGDPGCQDRLHHDRETIETHTVAPLQQEIPMSQQAGLDVAEMTAVAGVCPPDPHHWPHLCLAHPHHDAAVPPLDLDLHRVDDIEVVVDLVREDVAEEGGAGHLIAVHIEGLQTLLIRDLLGLINDGDLYHQAVVPHLRDLAAIAVVEFQHLDQSRQFVARHLEAEALHIPQMVT